MKSIREREQELFAESWKLREASFQISQSKGDKHKNYLKSKEIQKKQNETWKKKCFFENFIKQIEKENKNGKNKGLN